jgi:lysophospholipase L1-like esterase
MRVSHILQGIFLAAAPLLYGANSSTYLALGDSVPFGMNINLIALIPGGSVTSSQFLGYPEIVTQVESLTQNVTEINLACPGESSGSFIDTKVPDFGCNSPHPNPPFPDIPPFKLAVPFLLHVPYQGSQLAQAIFQLRMHPDTDLVTLSIGANDLFVNSAAFGAALSCPAKDPANKCVTAALAPVLGPYQTNLTAILTSLRTDGNYKGKLILLTYYSPAPYLNQITQAVNAAMVQAAAQYSKRNRATPALVADGYLPFQIASIPFGGDPCKAGLLIPLVGAPGCDIHPTRLGQSLLAGAIEFVNHTSLFNPAALTSAEQ